MFFETERSFEKNYLYTQSDENLDFVGHVHNSYEFVTVLEGELECSVYKEVYTLRPGWGMLIFPNHVHSFKTPSFSRSFLTIFSADFIADFHADMKSGGYSCAAFEFHDAEKLAVLQDKSANRYLLQSVLYGLCGLACTNMIQFYEPPQGSDISVKLLYYIQQNYDKPISLKKMAQDMGYSYTYLSNLFNRIFGYGFSRFVNRFRSENAAELLRLTDLGMVQISNRCGFESIRSFNEQFKSDYGVSPTDYRAEQRLKTRN